MTDTALDNALSRRDALAARINAAQLQIDEWKKEMVEADAFIDAWHKWAGTESPLAVVLPPHEPEPSSDYVKPAIPVSTSERRKRPLDNSKKEDVAAEVRRIIEERGHVVPRRELLPELVERGFVIEGTDPDMVLSTMLWRAGNAAGVVRVGRAGYWLLERDWPDANYFPQVVAELSEAIASGDLAVDQEAFGGIVSAMDRAIETVFADLETDRLTAINADIEKEIGLPQDVDRQLNEFVEDVLGRELSDRERLILTNRAAAAVKQQATGVFS